MRFDVITVGSGTLDIFVDTDISDKKGFICYPSGDKILIKNLRFDIGGGGTNTAVAFSRLSLKTGWIGKIGDDFAGRQILQTIKKEKITFLGSLAKKGQSGHSIILDSKEHNRTILTYKGVNDSLAISEINTQNLKTKWLYLSSMLKKSFKTQKQLAILLKKQGTKIAFNPSSYIIGKENLKKLLSITDILVLNKEEAEKLVDVYNPHERRIGPAILKLGPSIVVITNKDKETFCYSKNGVYSIKPHKIKVVERTGAGDAFASGFVAGQIVGLSIKESLKLALKESESVIRYRGAKNKLLTINLKKIAEHKK